MSDVLIRAGSFVAIIVLGYVLRKIGMFRKEDFKVLANVVLKITLPAAIVVSFAKTELTPSMLVMILFGRPLLDKLDRIKIKYGMIGENI